MDNDYHEGVELPAVSLYKIGDEYFVRDGTISCPSVEITGSQPSTQWLWSSEDSRVIESP